MGTSEAHAPEPATKSAAPKSRRRTWVGTLRELDALGVELSKYPQKPHAVKLLHKYDPDMLERILQAIHDADASTRTIWTDALGQAEFTDMAKKGAQQASEHMSKKRLSYERMLANTGLVSQIITALGTDFIPAPANFSTANASTLIEKATGINPGDDRYPEVQAGILYYVITAPEEITRMSTAVGRYRIPAQDIKTIVENMDKVLAVLPELCRRRDASHGTVTALISVAPALVDGAL